MAWPRTTRWAAERIARARRLSAFWVSTHLELAWSLLGYHWPFPALVPRPVARRQAVRVLGHWAAKSPAPILAENMPRSHCGGHAYLVDPTFITQVIKETSCRLLLDMAHARVSAALLEQPVRAYIERLPLDRLMEVHVSGPRPRVRRQQLSAARGAPDPGRLAAAHEPLQDEDYELLAWFLGAARPRAVTLEYRQDATMITEQLQRLRQVLDRSE